MELRAIRASARALAASGRRLRLVAPFDHVVNLEDKNGQVVAVQDDEAAFSPLSAVVHAESLELVRIAAERGPVVLNVTADETIDCGIRAMGPKPAEWVSSALAAARLLAREGSLAEVVAESANALTKDQRLAAEVIRLADRHIRAGRPADAGAALARLSGLGPGLTPAGDDFIVGVLAACAHDGSPTASAMAEGVARGLASSPDTTWLSRALLSCALAGEFSPALARLFSPADGRQLVRAVSEVVTFGHTSGSDALGGALWAARALLPR